eukprot:gene25902-8249_t
MGACCTKPPELPPGANRQVVVENAAFDSVRATTPRCDRCKAKIQFCVCNVKRETMSSSPRKLDSGTKQPASAQNPRRDAQSARGPATHRHPAGQGQAQQQQQQPQATAENVLKKKKEHQSQQPPPLPPARAATDCDRCKSKVQFCNCDADSSRPAPQQQAVPRVQRIVLSINDLALKCAGLGLDDGH